MIKQFDHVLLHGKKDLQETYTSLFESFPPRHILVFKETGAESLNPGLLAAADEHDVTPLIVETDSLNIPSPWTAEMIQSKPFSIFCQMFDGYADSVLDPDTSVVSIFAGTVLHKSMLMCFAMEIGAQIVLVDTPKESDPVISLQPWLSRNVSHHNLSKREGMALLGMLKHRIKDGPFNRKEHPDSWADANQIVGSMSGTNALKESGFSSTAAPLMDSGLIEVKGKEPSRYNLTALGWRHALRVWADSDISDSEGKRPGRIMPARVFRSDDEGATFNSLNIANQLPHVEDWIGVFQRKRDGMKPGIPLFDEHDSADDLSDVDRSEIEALLTDWNSSLESRFMNSFSWCLLDSAGNLEKLFSKFCEWIWPRMMADNCSRTWTMDLTHFMNNDLMIGGLFAQSLNLPTTYNLPPSGHRGPSGGKVRHPVQDRNQLVMNLPSWNLIHSICTEQSASLATEYKLLIALLYQEEEYNRLKDRHVNTQSMLDIEDPSREPFEGRVGASRPEMQAWIAEQIEAGHLPNSLDITLQNPLKNKLAANHLILIDEEGRGGTHKMRLSPTGRIIATLLRSRTHISEN